MKHKKLISFAAALAFAFSSTLCADAFQIFVKRQTGSTITVDVDNDNTVAEVKSLIWEKAGYRSAAQRLIFAGTVLEDTKKVSDYNIQRESILHLTLLSNDLTEEHTSDYTTINYGFEPRYTVTIPASVDVSSADKEETIKFSDVFLEENKVITVSLTASANTQTAGASDLVMKSGNGDKATYNVKKDGTAVALGCGVAAFSYNGTASEETQKITFTKPENVKFAGHYTDQLTFTIKVLSPPENADKLRYVESPYDCFEQNPAYGWRWRFKFDKYGNEIGTTVPKQVAKELAVYKSMLTGRPCAVFYDTENDGWTFLYAYSDGTEYFPNGGPYYSYLDNYDIYYVSTRSEEE